MDIIPLGHAAFKLKGKRASVVADPFDPAMVGLKFPKHVTGSIITVSHQHQDHNFIAGVELSEGQVKPLVFSGPGEYEAAGMEITGIATFHDAQQGKERGNNTVFQITIDGVTIVHCGDLGHKLTDAQVDLIENTDILLIPVGGTYTIDADVATQVVNQLEPSLVIPMHYQRQGLSPQLFSALAPVSSFLKKMGKESLTPQPKLTITKDKLPTEIEVVVLE